LGSDGSDIMESFTDADIKLPLEKDYSKYYKEYDAYETDYKAFDKATKAYWEHYLTLCIRNAGRLCAEYGIDGEAYNLRF
jgi:hypothetical protein